MVTCAETIKEVLEAFDWSTVAYGSQPGIAIHGIQEEDRVPVDKNIILMDLSEDPVYTTNEDRIYSPLFCQLILSETLTSLRDDLYEAIRYIFEKSTKSILIRDPKADNLSNVFKIKMKIQMLG